MNDKKPHILLVNDDGIHAPGLKHLWNSLKDSCNLSIVAPASEQSAVGLSVTIRHPIHVESVRWEEEIPCWKITGTPADCVRIALKALLPTPPDFIVSGINCGTNAGRNLLYSGTVGGIIEATIRSIPGIAFSSEDFLEPNYAAFEHAVFPLVSYVLSHPLPKGSFLNVTFPSKYHNQQKGVRLARQGMSYYKENLCRGTHPEGKEYYWMGGAHEYHEEQEDSDVHLLQQGYITAVPIQINELTNLTELEARRGHFQQLLN